MQVNAVKTNATDFGNYGQYKRDRIEAFALADDQTLRQMSRVAASQQINDKKHQRISNALWCSLPIAAGFAKIVSNPGVIGRIPKLKLFTREAAIWAGTFAVIDATWALAKGLSHKSEAVSNFNEKHPVASTILTLGATVAALFAANKGANWLIGKYGKNVVNFLKSHNVDKFIKENKVITNVMSTVRKAPSALKELTKGLISWSPLILVATSIGHTFSHEKARAVAEVNNYETLKASQNRAREILAERNEITEGLDGE
ncbi:hypothetical protein IKR55_01795 [bacterium]|jgi:hypothetical protein|nr:hypothetical protein [bacterium]